ncbi:MAG: hypothetical protein WD992_02800 [Candidatus Levyibacteriota bacterium]
MRISRRSRLFLRKMPTLPLVNKRQIFIFAVFVLSLGLFVTQYLFGKSGIVAVFLLSVLTDFFVFWALQKDFKERFVPQVFILPFFYSLAFGLFYFLVPARFLTRIAVTLVYSFGLYSLFLSENIFTVSAIRTIALLSSARTVSFVITILSYFFLSNVVISLHLNIFYLLPLLFIFTFALALHSVWTYSLEIRLKEASLWAGLLTICILEVGMVLWFWPSRPTVIALFLTGFFYSVIGLTQAWFDKRLFRNVILEYVWVAAIVFFVLVLFTSWIG